MQTVTEVVKHQSAVQCGFPIVTINTVRIAAVPLDVQFADPLLSQDGF